MSALAAVLFWATAGAVTATYFLYPAALWVAVRLRRARAREWQPAADPPRVTVVVVAYNEAAVIAGRLRNLAALDYPRDRLDIVVLSDGSTDGTEEVARAAAPAHARVVHSPARSGKSGTLSRAQDLLEGEIVAFTDANSEFEADALRHLVAPFADPTVGCVVGCLRYTNTTRPQVARGEGLYWRYENGLKALESALGSTIVANGSIYAVRRRHLRLDVTHVDFDSLLPLKVLQAGDRVVFAPDARASEEAAESLGEEFRRKVRIINQQIWGLREVGGLLSRRTLRVFAAVFFHKILRWSVPFALAVNIVAAWSLPEGALRTAALGAHGLVAAAGAAGWLLPAVGLPAGPLRSVTYFWAVNLASAVAAAASLAGRRFVAWETARSAR